MMAVERCFTAERLNEIANHPAVLPWVKGPLPGPLDLTPAVADRRNVLLMAEHGGMLFQWLQPALYEIHTVVLPCGRGAGALAMAHAALHWMFCRTDALELITRCPYGNVAARALIRRTNLEFQFTAPRGWFGDRGPISADVFSMTLSRWVRFASTLDGGDNVHARHCSAAVAMRDGGYRDKAANLFNRWAAVSNNEFLSNDSR